MSFITTDIKKSYFEETESNIIFYPDGKIRFGKVKTYYLKSDDDVQILLSFLEKFNKLSIIFILVSIAILFGSLPFSFYIFGDLGLFPSLIIGSAVIIVFRRWYDHRINQLTSSFEMVPSYRRIRDIKIGVKKLVIGFILACIVVIEGYVILTGAQVLLNNLK